MAFSGDGLAHEQLPRKPTNAKLEQLAQITAATPLHGRKHLSVFSNTPVDNVDTAMKAGARGPTTIDDPVARERISHFDHERIPERVVHARGAGAHGVFKLHTSLADVTCAEVLTNTSIETPTFVRFSTVLGSNGAAETAREVRGFATKFYTQQGNWDLVGNNISVFFMSEGAKFVDLIHAAKPEPQIHLPQAQTAHDSFWDFISLMPESAHMIAWMLSDHTIPRSYRMMQGFGVNTFTLVNKDGKRTFVKFHWRPHLGKHSLVWDEALKLGGQDPDFLRRDLAEAIEAGAYPKYEFGVQLIPEEDEDKFEYDLLDCTKLVPEEDVPIKWVGTMTLNANPTNYFAETEQVAYCTSNIVPGIDFSNDPMLQLRNFSYFDTQLSRLGGPNFAQIPINKGVCPFISTIRDGSHQHRIPAGPHYWPNRFDLPDVAQKNGANYVADEADAKKATTVNPEYMTFAPHKVEGLRGRQRGPKFNEHYSQAQLFYNSMSEVEKQHIIEAAIFEVSRCDWRDVQERMIARFAEIDHSFAEAVATGFDIPVPKPKTTGNHGRKSDGTNPLSMLSPNNEFTATGRKIAVFALDGYDATQVQAMQAALSAIGIIVMIIGNRKGPAYPAGVKVGDEKASGVVQTNFTPESCRSTYFDALFFPSGDETYAKALKQGRVIHFVREAFGHCKALAAAGASVPWLAHTALAGVTDIKANPAEKFSVSKGVVLSENLAGDETSLWKKLTEGKQDINFASAFIDAIAAHRHWDRDTTMVAF